MRGLLAATCGFVLVAGAAGAVTVLDDFDYVFPPPDPQVASQTGPGTSSGTGASFTDSSNAIGRGVQATVDVSGGADDAIDARVDTADGRFTVSATSIDDSGFGAAAWSVQGGNVIDFTALGTAVRLKSVEATSPFTFALTLDSIRREVDIGPTTGPQDVDFPLSGFAGADLANISGFSLDVSTFAVDEATASIDAISVLDPAAVVPLPATGLLLVAGLGGLAVIRARRRTG